MQRTHAYLRLLSTIALALLVSQSILAVGPGFGLRKRTITLQMRKPALVRLQNTSVAFKGRVLNVQYDPVLGIIEMSLGIELVGNEGTLINEPKAEDAEWVVSLTVTGYTAPTSKARTETNGRVTTTVTRWNGSLNVAYQVLDKMGRVHDADNVAATFDKDFPSSSGAGLFGLPNSTTPAAGMPHSPEEVRQILVKDVVQQIASNLGNAVQPLELQVAVGDDSLSRVSAFFEEKLWARSIEELEKIPAYPNQRDESYRQYNLGLAYEALSYDAKTYSDQRANLLKAQEYYDRAAELHPAERYYVQSVARTKDLVARYRTLDTMLKSGKPAGSSSGVATASPPDEGPKPDGRALTVYDVIEMYREGVERTQIIDLIRTSVGDYQFDTTALIAMIKARLPLDVQNEMRKKAGLGPLPSKPATNHPPIVNGACAPCDVRPGERSTLTAIGDDRDGDPLTYQWSADGGTLQEATAREAFWTAPMTEGTIAITVMARDNKNGAAKATVLVRVARLTAARSTGHERHFPWPLPPWTTRLPLSLSDAACREDTYAEAFACLANRVKDVYPEWSAYPIPEGFVIVMQMESIYRDGRPLPAPRRWLKNPPFSLEDGFWAVLRRLATAERGRYRIMVLVFTRLALLADRNAQAKELQSLPEEGGQRFPTGLAPLASTAQATLTALVYEFEKEAGGQTRWLKADDSGLEARDHLRLCGLFPDGAPAR